MSSNKALFLSVLIFMVMDVCYIYIVKTRYMQMISNIQQGDHIAIRVYAIILCYIFVIGGLVFYVIPYAKKLKGNRHISLKDTLYYAFTVGGVFGAIVYGVYNLTNLSLFKYFSLTLAITDIIWGVVLYTTATLIYLLVE
jgi:uncharacterized membrane protein